MKVFLAATSTKAFMEEKLKCIPYVLESFYSIEDWQLPLIRDNWEMFLLDSGAFTFMNGCKQSVDWKQYVDDYCDFIIKNDIKYFFELDIDVIVGYDNVKRITKYIEQKTQKKPIPVWHKSRGIEEWKRLCAEYDYVAIGGIVTKEIKEQDYKFLPELIRIAHKNGCKVHGLGFTSMKWLPHIPFDSVDSTNWQSGGRFGQMHSFDGRRIVSRNFAGKRAIYKKLDAYNLDEWIKFQKYMRQL